MTLNHGGPRRGGPRRGGLSDSELDAVLTAVDDELLRCVRATAHANAALLAVMAAGARYAGIADISSARRGDGEDRALAVIELRSMARDDHGLRAALAQARELGTAVKHARDRQDTLTRMRSLDRARHLQRRSARDRTRARAASVARELGRLRDLDGALKDVASAAELLIATLSRVGDLGRTLRAGLRDLDALKDVTWTTATIWPDDIADQVRAISQEIRPRIYKARAGSEQDPADLAGI